MSKITFRADDDLVRQLEGYDASKSEVMREALRTYLETDDEDVNGDADAVNAESGGTTPEESIDDVVAERVDAVLADRLEDTFTPAEPRDVNVNITLDQPVDGVTADAEGSRKTTATSDADAGAADATTEPCKQCGETLPDDAVYCANCGEKAAHRVFCECGDELRSDWAFCPGCGRRTPAADVLRDT
jgi:predicted transcriptional regulator